MRPGAKQRIGGAAFASRLAGSWLPTLHYLILVCWAVGLVLIPEPSLAQSMRVTTWNLGLEPDIQPNRADLDRAAAVLRTLDPDVILLQEIPNWRTCIELTELLKPADYHVLVCSAFRGASPTAAPQPQVAILSKKAAYFTWTEPWPGSNAKTASEAGMVFAAIQTSTQRLGFFAALATAQQAGQELAKALLADLNTIKDWETNQVQTFVVSVSTSPSISNPTKFIRRAAIAFERAGLVDAAEQLPELARSTLRPAQGQPQENGDCLFGGPAGFPGQALIQLAFGFKHYPITSDIELDPEKVGLALDLRTEAHRERDVQARLLRTKLAVWIGAGLVVCLFVGRIVRSRARKRRPAPAVPRPALPARVSPKSAPSPLRPIIFIESPAKGQGAPDAPAPSKPKPKPVLRLQASPRLHSQPADASPGAAAPAAGSAAAPLERSPRSGANPEPPQLPTAKPSLALNPEVRHGVIQELAGWLKQKFVRKLVSDREQMMHAQQLATRMASTLDNRLARIEAQIQEQNQAYIRRIDELNSELAAAREENRELIRERIAQVKAEMEAARAKVLAEANLSNTSLRL